MCSRTAFWENLLTYHLEVNGKVDFRLRVNLTLKNTRVSRGDSLHSQVPIVRIEDVNDGEARVGRVDECVWCQNCEISSSHPRNLTECGRYFSNDLCRKRVNRQRVLRFYFPGSSPCIWAWRSRQSAPWHSSHCRRSTVCRARQIWLLKHLKDIKSFSFPLSSHIAKIAMKSLP